MAGDKDNAQPSSPLPSPTLPKGGGAIRDVGEKFSTNPATGAGSLTIPLFVSPGRGGFHPELALQYDSGKGNGPYGVGWSLSVPRITRKTDKGLPRYLEDSDTFILSGAEDLVPALQQSGAHWVRDELVGTDENGAQYDVLRFRPRVESQYARIECWTRRSDADVHWRSITRDNIRSIYGRSTTARISDPDAPGRVFSWLLDETRDGKGNIIAYEYKLEDQENIDRAIAAERPRAVANAYLERISYGNQSPDAAGDWHFQVLFDYGEHDDADPVNGPLGVWPGRQDPFSDFRSTFEVRTYRLCRRILMLHDFAELGPGWTVVRSTELSYDENPVSTYLRSVRQRGWLRNADGTYDRSLALPPVDLDYSRPTINPEIHTVDPTSLANLPAGLAGRSYQLLDLDAEGLPGILTQQAGAFFYNRNDGDGHFGAVETLAMKPSIAELASGVQQVTDVDGSGEKFLVQLGRAPQGYFERTERGWDRFFSFRSLPNLDWGSAALKYLDLDGDGLPDILKLEGELHRWWGSLGRGGYGDERRVTQPRDDDKGPYVVWTDPRQAILIADMTGDGLPDIVRVIDGSVSYWPNRGYGRFGAKVTMRNAPRFAGPEQFDPARLRVADVDGSGTADLIYLESGTARVWLNQSGNGYAVEQAVPFPSPADDSVTVADLLGKGTACLVWSSPLPANQGRQMRYVDLMSGIKPHLLTSVKNNLGATTTVTYLPSTKFYLDDRNAGLPWVTKLPFPVHVVASVETDEAVTGTRLVTTYRYHHGHYDGIEREFAGFGMVEQEDAETLQQGTGAPFAYTPPKRIKTWFDTGAFFESGPVSTQYRREYSPDFPQLVPDSTGPAGITPDEAREAARARRGRIVRQELVGLDGSALEPHPYTVAESNFEVRRIQPRDGNRYAAFDVIPRETLTVHSERNPGDPRSEHDVTLAVDAFGNVLEATHVAYARNGVVAVPQARTFVTYKQADYVNLTAGTDYYRVGLVRESRTYELTGLPPPAANGVYSRAELAGLVAQINGSPSAEIDFSVTTPPATPARRLFERTRRVFVGDQPADDKLLALGLVVDTQQAALTATLVDDVYQSLVADPNARNQLFSDNKYIGDPGLWWAPTGQTVYVPALFYQAQQFTDPFGNVSTVEYDPYALLLHSATNAAGTPYATTATVQSDYRVLAPSVITDANGNRAQAELDALGRVTKTWAMGKTTEAVGDDAAHPSTRIEYHLEVVPPYVYVEKREEHWYTDPANAKLQRAYSYSDGLGREVLTKKQAQPDASGAARWTGTGRTVFDNKGNPVQKFEPYFSTTPAYEAVITGVSDLLHYDPLNRVVRVDHPNGSYSRVEFGELVQSGTGWTHQLNAWGQVSYDENDTVAEPNNAWYGKYSAGTPDEQDAAGKTLAQNKIATPTRLRIDPLGRMYLTEQDNGFDAAGKPSLFATTLALDIQGNQRTVTDARGVAVVTSTFDMLGRTLVVDSVDAGIKTVLLDAAGAVAHEWNPNAIEIAREYDPKRRQRRVWVSESGGPQRLAERTFYGETLVDAASHNLYGRVYCQLDGAGLVRNADYDFKGNLLSTSRQLASAYDQKANWTDVADPTVTTAPLGVSGVEAETFATTTVYDALNRIVRAQVPSGTPNVDHVVLPGYNETGLLGSMGVQLDGAATTTPFVTRVDYNEKEQRLAIAYGNGVTTEYSYELETFRLSSIMTTKTTKGDLQALAYTYDPVGNITTIEDGAQQTLFVGNSKVSPRTRYTYDAIYRLIYALGREHAGQALPDQTSTPDGVPIPSPTDPQAMRLYAETYQYDAVGNFLAMIHAVTNSQGQFQNLWTRTYTSDASSNRLLSTVTGDGATSTPTTYQHDLAGNITAMSPAPLPTIEWDYRNQLVHAVSSRGDTYCSYDAAGQRVRKVLVPPSGPIKERIYLGAYEIYREHSHGVGSGTLGSITLERRTLHVSDGKRRIVLVEFLTVGTPSAPGSVNDGPAQLSRYQLDNHLGSAALELDGAAKLLSYEEYHPYGTTAYRATDGALATSPKRYSFVGKERDAETGLAYHDARYYAPWLGRWTAPDPAETTVGASRYQYPSNPISKADMNGLWELDMHFLGIYWTGRIQGASHELALRVALASQMPDDVNSLKAPERKKEAELRRLFGPNNPSPVPGLSGADYLMRTANNLHALAIDPGAAENIARKGIETHDPYLFGLGLHRVGDLRPHATLAGDEPSVGHHEGHNENGSESHWYSTAADKTANNPRKALDTLAHFSELWHEYLGKKGPTEIDPRQAQLLTVFALTDKWSVKADAFKESGYNGVESVLALTSSSRSRLAMLANPLWVNKSDVAAAYGKAMGIAGADKNDQLSNYRPIDVGSLNNWQQLHLPYPKLHMVTPTQSSVPRNQSLDWR